MAPKGKTVAERVIVLETIAEGVAKFQETVIAKMESIETKIDVQTKVNEIHTAVMSGMQPKTPLEKFGNAARNIRDVIMVFAVVFTLLAIFLKVDFTALIK